MEIIEDAAGVRFRESIPRIIQVANPAGGADWSTPVPGGSMWYPLGVTAQIVTSATVQNRNIALIYSAENLVVARTVAPAVIPATTTARLSWARGLGTNGQTTTLSQQSTGLPTIPLLPAMTIGVSTIGIDGTDAWTNIIVYVLEVEERPYDVELDMDIATLAGKMSLAVPSFPYGV